MSFALFACTNKLLCNELRPFIFFLAQSDLLALYLTVPPKGSVASMENPLSQSLVKKKGQQLIGFSNSGCSCSKSPKNIISPNATIVKRFMKGSRTGYFSKLILCCATDIFGTETWGREGGATATLPPSPFAAYERKARWLKTSVLRIKWRLSLHQLVEMINGKRAQAFQRKYDDVTRYLFLTEFEGRTVNYGPQFFPINLWPKREARGP